MTWFLIVPIVIAVVAFATLAVLSVLRRKARPIERNSKAHYANDTMPHDEPWG